MAEPTLPADHRRTLALIAHDRQKDDMQAFCARHLATMRGFALSATGTTGTAAAPKPSVDHR